MPAEIINLRQARKQRARDEKEARATENRARFGRSKAERQQDERSQERAEKSLDGHLRTPPSDGPSPPAEAADEARPPETDHKPPQ